MNIIIENEIFDNQAEIVLAAQKLGFTYRLVDYSNVLKSNELSDNPRASTILGSCRFLKYSKYKPQDNIITWCDFESLQCSEYYPHISGKRLNQNYFIKPFGDLTLEDAKHFNSENVFIKPNTNDKIFDGTLVDLNHFTQWLSDIKFTTNVQKNTLCLLAEPQENIEAEIRCICDTDGYITYSVYKANDGITILDKIKMQDYIASLWNENLKSYLDNVMPLYVADLALINNEFRVLELSSINCSHWYIKNINELINILTAIHKYTRE